MNKQNLQLKTKDFTEELDIKTMHLMMGPSHPAMHGAIRIELDIYGEKIIDADVQIGYLHRGFEKMCENRTYNQGLIYTDRLNYVSPIINNVGYSMAAEKLLGIEIPERAKYIRVIMCELSRIADHLTCLAAGSMEMGALTVFLYLMQAREAMYEFIEETTGARITTAYTRIGGVANDLPENSAEKIQQKFVVVKKVLSDVKKLLLRNKIFMDRLVNVAVVSKEMAIDYAFTGPCLRASGVSYDVRRAFPYLVYDQLDFKIPIGEVGDNYDRFVMRLEEIEQSMKIINQAIQQIPTGDFIIPDFHFALPDKSETYTNIEALISHFKVIMNAHGIKPPKGEVYIAVEGGNGEVGFYVVSDGSEIPYRVHLRAPTIPLASGLREMILGHQIADIVPTFGMQNFIMGEVDR